jgi:ribokinase
MPTIAVIGSVNLDIVARAPQLPVAGETVTGAELHRFPGGKGANQALAAQRLGADVSLVARVGDDVAAEEALALLREGGVNLSECRTVPGMATGTALIAVDPAGENQIVVAPGANRCLTAEKVEVPRTDAVICQLEIPLETIASVARAYRGFLCVNLAPATRIDVEILQRADLVVVNETEAAWYGETLTDRDRRQSQRSIQPAREIRLRLRSRLPWLKGSHPKMRSALPARRAPPQRPG